MEFKELRTKSKMNLKEYSQYFSIPYRTLQNWENKERKCPEYLLNLMKYKLENEKLI